MRNRRLGGYKFAREKVIGNYIVDFVCREEKLILEIDGGQHMDAIPYDEQRTKNLERRGYRVLRVWNHEVFNNIEGIGQQILYLLEGVLTSPPSSPALLPQVGEGS